MKYIRHLTLALTAVSLVGCMTVDPGQVAKTYWVPQPQKLDAEARWVAPGDTVLQQEVRPEQVARVSALEFGSVTGSATFIEPDAVLSLHRARMQDGGAVFCVPQTKAAIPVVARILAGSARKVKCLKDSDGDGAFELVYETDKPMHALPIVDGNMGKPEPLPKPLAYRTQKNAGLDEPYYVEVRYTGIPLLYGNRRNFDIYGRQGDGEPEDLTTTVDYANVKDLPAVVTVAGARFEITETDGNRIKVRTLSKIPPAPFTIFTQTTYQVYYY